MRKLLKPYHEGLLTRSHSFAQICRCKVGPNTVEDIKVENVGVSKSFHAYSRASIVLLASSLLAMRSYTHGSHT